MTFVASAVTSKWAKQSGGPAGDEAQNLVANPLEASEPAHAGSSVRRLTPQEAERLQGFPDGWTRVPADAPDSRRYAALGDAVTVTVGEWIGRRILEARDG